MRFDFSGRLWMLGAKNGPSFDTYTSTGSTTVNEWVQVVAVWTSTGYYTYINGINSGYDLTKTFLVQQYTDPLEIGVFTGDSSHYKGDISIFRLYNRVLTSDEVLSNFNAQKDRFGL